MKGESDMENNWVEELVEHLEVHLEGGTPNAGNQETA